MKKIEILAKITVNEDSFNNDEMLYGEYLEKTMKQIEDAGIELIDYSVIHHTSINTKEMYFNYLMNFALQSNYDMENPSPLSYEEWKERECLI